MSWGDDLPIYPWDPKPPPKTHADVWTDSDNSVAMDVGSRGSFSSLPVFGGAAGNGPVAVDTHALVYFADVLDQLREPIESAIKELGTIDVRPGNFFHADQIVTKVAGTNGTGADGLKTLYTDNLTRMRDGLLVLGRRLRELAAKYDTIEELNSAGGPELAELMGEVRSFLPQLGPSGVPTMPPPMAPS